MKQSREYDIHILNYVLDDDVLCGMSIFRLQRKPVLLTQYKRKPRIKEVCPRCRKIALLEFPFMKDRGLSDRPDWLIERLPENLHYIDSDIALLFRSEQRIYARPTPARFTREERGKIYIHRRKGEV